MSNDTPMEAAQPRMDLTRDVAFESRLNAVANSNADETTVEGPMVLLKSKRTAPVDDARISKNPRVDSPSTPISATAIASKWHNASSLAAIVSHFFKPRMGENLSLNKQRRSLSLPAEALVPPLQEDNANSGATVRIATQGGMMGRSSEAPHTANNEQVDPNSESHAPSCENRQPQVGGNECSLKPSIELGQPTNQSGSVGYEQTEEVAGEVNAHFDRFFLDAIGGQVEQVPSNRRAKSFNTAQGSASELNSEIGLDSRDTVRDVAETTKERPTMPKFTFSQLKSNASAEDTRMTKKSFVGPLKASIANVLGERSKSSLAAIVSHFFKPRIGENLSLNKQRRSLSLPAEALVPPLQEDNANSGATVRIATQGGMMGRSSEAPHTANNEQVDPNSESHAPSSENRQPQVGRNEGFLNPSIELGQQGDQTTNQPANVESGQTAEAPSNGNLASGISLPDAIGEQVEQGSLNGGGGNTESTHNATVESRSDTISNPNANIPSPAIVVKRSHASPSAQTHFEVGPAFTPTQNFSQLYISSTNTSINPTFLARIDRGVFLEGDEYVTYKKRYVTLVACFQLDGDGQELMENHKFYLLENGIPKNVACFYLNLNFKVDGEASDIVQWTIKQEMEPFNKERLVVTGELPTHDCVKNGKDRNYFYEVTSRFPNIISILTDYPDGCPIEQCAKFERFSFECKPYKKGILEVQLLAKLDDGHSEVLASIETPPIVNRAGSPADHTFKLLRAYGREIPESLPAISSVSPQGGNIIMHDPSNVRSQGGSTGSPSEPLVDALNGRVSRSKPEPVPLYESSENFSQLYVSSTNTSIDPTLLSRIDTGFHLKEGKWVGNKSRYITAVACFQLGSDGEKLMEEEKFHVLLNGVKRNVLWFSLKLTCHENDKEVPLLQCASKRQNVPKTPVDARVAVPGTLPTHNEVSIIVTLRKNRNAKKEAFFSKAVIGSQSSEESIYYNYPTDSRLEKCAMFDRIVFEKGAFSWGNKTPVVEFKVELLANIGGGEAVVLACNKSPSLYIEEIPVSSYVIDQKRWNAAQREIQNSNPQPDTHLAIVQEESTTNSPVNAVSQGELMGVSSENSAAHNV